MFVLAEMKDVIRVTPEHFHQSLTESITTLLNRKLANKVVLNVGLCIALFDITDIGHSYIFPGDGSSHTEVKFRYIVFRPGVEEILIGKIRSCSREGVHVTLGFFDDILIPVNALQHPSRFDETDQAWVWEYPKEDGEKHDLFMDSDVTKEDTPLSLTQHIPQASSSNAEFVAVCNISYWTVQPHRGVYCIKTVPYARFHQHSQLFRKPLFTDYFVAENLWESIRFRVTSEAFEESLPTGPPGTECTVQTVAPYRLIGGINEPGLGLLTWWESPEQEDCDENDDQENDE